MDRSLVRHAHPHCHMLLKVEGADTQFSVGDRIVALTDEQAVLINAWEPHSYAHYVGQPATIILALYIEPDWLGAFRANWQASSGPGFFRSNVGTVSPGIRQKARRLAEAMVGDPGDLAEHERLLGQLMVAVIERFTEWQAALPSLRMAAGFGIDHRVRKAISIMRTDPAGVDDMTRLARDIGLSRAHFFRLFETTMHVSPRVYLNVVRLEQAVNFIVDSDASLATISERLGFSVPAHFSRFFHDHAGSSPSTYRAVSSLRGCDFETLG
ncbi:AraC-like DNA-binding protein [Rhizobium halophytocola]|uniref:AraC-like DNA-binding protein n=2 Tax=Rhizobium halophytocola TaxID=735519 RepID=A0ABS4DUC1_9HYPH|nr:AraC-like DNA-binding protein [Rhizobium halophytocola]